MNEYFSWSDSAGGLGGYEILKVHDADPFLGVEVKFVDVATCQQFLESYSSGTVRQSLSQHACRLLALPQELAVETQLKASTHILDLYLDKLELCLQHIHLSQVNWMFLFVYFLGILRGSSSISNFQVVGTQIIRQPFHFTSFIQPYVFMLADFCHPNLSLDHIDQRNESSCYFCKTFIAVFISSMLVAVFHELS